MRWLLTLAHSHNTQLFYQHYCNDYDYDYDIMATGQAWIDACTYETCSLDWSYWGYRPSFAANVAFTALFALSMVAYLAQGIVGKRWLGFTIAMVAGCLIEVIGYAGRVMAYNDLFHEVCLAILPFFTASGNSSTTVHTCDFDVDAKLPFPPRTDPFLSSP